MKNIKILFYKSHEDAKMPEYGTEHSAGADIFSIVDAVIAPGHTVIIPTGLLPIIPIGYKISVAPKSGLSSKTKMRLSNAPGTIDSDYRGEMGVIIDNIGQIPIHIDKGQKIAQIFVEEVIKISPVEIDEKHHSSLKTDRGDGGYGSTGLK